MQIPTNYKIIAKSNEKAHLTPRVILITSAYNILFIAKSSATSISKILDLIILENNHYMQLYATGRNKNMDQNHPTE